MARERIYPAKEPMIKHHVQLKLFAHQHNVKQVISTSTMCCVGSPCVFWPRQTEHETHRRPTFYSQVVRLTADQQSESQPLILSNVGPSLIMLIARSSMSVLQTFMLPCCLTIQLKMCLALSKLFQTVFCSSFFYFLTCFHVSCCALIY